MAFLFGEIYLKRIKDIEEYWRINIWTSFQESKNGVNSESSFDTLEW